MGKFMDLGSTFKDFATYAMLPKVKKMSDEELLRSFAYHVHNPDQDSYAELLQHKHEVVRRLNDNPSNSALQPYGEAISTIPAHMKDSGVAVIEALADLTAPLYVKQPREYPSRGKHYGS